MAARRLLFAFLIAVFVLGTASSASAATHGHITHRVAAMLRADAGGILHFVHPRQGVDGIHIHRPNTSGSLDVIGHLVASDEDTGQWDDDRYDAAMPRAPAPGVAIVRLAIVRSPAVHFPRPSSLHRFSGRAPPRS
jgi:hypothetical protein